MLGETCGWTARWKLKQVMICREKIEKQRDMWHSFYILAQLEVLRRVDDGEGGDEFDIPGEETGPDTSLGTWYLVPFLRMRWLRSGGCR